MLRRLDLCDRFKALYCDMELPLIEDIPLCMIIDHPSSQARTSPDPLQGIQGPRNGIATRHEIAWQNYLTSRVSIRSLESRF